MRGFVIASSFTSLEENVTVFRSRGPTGTCRENVSGPMLDPPIVVLGGALVAHGDSVVAEVRRVVGRIIPTPPTIEVSSLPKEAPLWGSLLLATTEARAHVRQQLAQRRAG